MHKKGQFFLIAALVIVGIVIGLGAIYVSTTATPRTETRIYDLSKEIDYESNQVIDYGVYTSTGEKTGSNIKSLMDYYVKTSPDTDMLFIYGNRNSIQGFRYESKPSGSAGISTGGASQEIMFKEVSLQQVYPKVVGNEIIVKFGGRSYTFALKEGENFYIILQKQAGEETIVAVR
jgi:hypothetical protein